MKRKPELRTRVNEHDDSKKKKLLKSRKKSAIVRENNKSSKTCYNWKKAPPLGFSIIKKNGNNVLVPNKYAETIRRTFLIASCENMNYKIFKLLRLFLKENGIILSKKKIFQLLKNKLYIDIVTDRLFQRANRYI